MGLSINVHFTAAAQNLEEYPHKDLEEFAATVSQNQEDLGSSIHGICTPLC